MFNKVLSNGDKNKPNTRNGTTLIDVTANLERESILCSQPQLRHLSGPYKLFFLNKLHHVNVVLQQSHFVMGRTYFQQRMVLFHHRTLKLDLFIFYFF